MFWFLITILSCFFSALAALGDKYLLSGLPGPKSYSFYVGILGILVLVLVPFVGFTIPAIDQVFLSLLAGSIFELALFALYTALNNFETSRVIPAIGGILPLSTFGLTYLLSPGKEILGLQELIAFIFLVLGSVFIGLEESKGISFKSFKISAIAAFLFAFSFVLSKFVYLKQPFWSGFILMRIGGFLVALCFLWSKEVKKDLFQRKFAFQKKTSIIFLLNQVVGSGSSILQNWAIALVPFGLLPFVNALEGTKYVFLLIFTVFLSLKFPKILKEEISRKILSQKLFAILLIGLGLILLTFR